MNKLFLLVLASAFLSISCKKMPVSSTVIGIDTINKIEFNPQYIDFDYLSTKTKLEYSDGANNDQYALTLRARKDSVIWVSIGKAGVEGVRGLLRPDSLFMLDKMKNVSYSYDLNYLQQLIQSKLSYYNIQNLLIGDLLFPYEAQDEVAINDNHFIVIQKRDKLHIESFVRLDNSKVDKVNINDAASLSKTNVVYSNFILADSILAPSVCALDIDYNKDGQAMHTKLTLTHSKIEYTSKPQNFPFNVPKKYNEK